MFEINYQILKNFIKIYQLDLPFQKGDVDFNEKVVLNTATQIKIDVNQEREQQKLKKADKSGWSKNSRKLIDVNCKRSLIK